MTFNPFTDLTPYDLRHLVSHLAEAGRAVDVHDLLALETSDGHNAWYEARADCADEEGYLADLARAWRLADEAACTDHPSPWTLALQSRYALISASLNSLVSDISPQLFDLLMEWKVWSQEQGLARVARMIALGEGAMHLTALIPHLSSSLLRQAVALARELPEDGMSFSLGQLAHVSRRAKALVQLILCMPPEMRSEFLPEVIGTIKRGGDPSFQAEMLATLLPHVNPTQREHILQEAWNAARKVECRLRSDSLVALICHIPESGRGEALLEALAYNTKSERRAWLLLQLADAGLSERALMAALDAKDVLALVQLAHHIPAVHLWQTIAGMPKVVREGTKAVDHIKQLCQFPETQREHSLPDLLAVVRGMKRRAPASRALMLAMAADGLPAARRIPVLSEALVAAQSISDDGIRVLLMGRLITELAEAGHPQDALAMVPLLKQPDSQAEVLRYLVRPVPESLSEEALAVARGIECATGINKSSLLVELTRNLPAQRKIEVLREISEAQDIDPNHQADTLAQISLEFAKADLPGEAVAIVRRIEQKERQVQALVKVARYLSESCLQEILTEIEASEPHATLPTVLVGLAPYLPRALCLQALSLVRSIEHDPLAWTRVVTALMGHMSFQEQEPLLRRALELAEAAPDVEASTLILKALTPCLPEPMWPRLKALLSTLLRSQMQTIGDADEQVRTLAHLRIFLHRTGMAGGTATQCDPQQTECPAIPGPTASRSEWSQQLKAVRRIRDGQQRARAIESLAPHLPDWLMSAALEAGLAIRSLDARLRAIEVLTPYLPEQMILQVIETIPWTTNKRALSRVVPKDALSQVLKPVATRLAQLGHPEEALSLCRIIPDEWRRAEALASIVHHLELSPLQVDSTLGFARTMVFAETRARVLVKLVNLLAERGRIIEAVTTAHALDHRCWAQAITCLAPNLSEVMLRQALVIAHSMPSRPPARRRFDLPGVRDLAYAGLAPRLVQLGHHQEALTLILDLGDVQRAETLVASAPSLSERLLKEALAAAQSIHDQGVRVRTLVALAAQCAQIGCHQEAVTIAQELPEFEGFADTGFRLLTVAALIPHLPMELKAEAIDSILTQKPRLIPQPALMYHVPAALRAEVLYEVLAHRPRLAAMVAMAPYLPDNAQSEIWQEALALALAIDNREEREQVLSKLIPHLMRLSTQAQLRIWIGAPSGTNVLRVVARRHRSDVLSDLRTLSPVLESIGGALLVEHIITSIIDVGRWWKSEKTTGRHRYRVVRKLEFSRAGPIILGGSLLESDLTPKEGYHRAQENLQRAMGHLGRIREKMTSIDPDGIYVWSNGNTEPEGYSELYVRSTPILKTTAKRYQVMENHTPRTLPRVPLDTQGTVVVGRDNFARGWYIQPLLKEIEVEMLASVERRRGDMGRTAKVLKMQAESVDKGSEGTGTGVTVAIAPQSYATANEESNPHVTCAKERWGPYTVALPYAAKVRAALLGTMGANANCLIRVLAAVPTKFIEVLNARARQLTPDIAILIPQQRRGDMGRTAKVPKMQDESVDKESDGTETGVTAAFASQSYATCAKERWGPYTVALPDAAKARAALLGTMGANANSLIHALAAVPTKFIEVLNTRARQLAPDIANATLACK